MVAEKSQHQRVHDVLQMHQRVAHKRTNNRLATATMENCSHCQSHRYNVTVNDFLRIALAMKEGAR